MLDYKVILEELKEQNFNLSHLTNCIKNKKKERI